MSLLADLQFGLRTMRRSPGFAAAAILTLGLGIGASTAIYSVVHHVLLQPLGFREPDRLVVVNTKFLKEAREIARITGGDLEDIRKEDAVFEAFTTLNGGELGIQVNGRAEFAGFHFVNAGFFDVMQVRPVSGSAFRDADAENAVVVGAAFARRNFDSVQAAVGQKLRMEGAVYEIAGVMPDGFAYPRNAELWAAAPFKPTNLNRTAYNYRAVARLRPGVSLEQANARLDALGAGLAAAHPASNQDKRFSVTGLLAQTVRPIRDTLYFLLGAVGLLLLIACANVANLLLARSTGRIREIAVRSAVGASRARIAMQLLSESLLLAIAGGAVGVLFATWGVGLLSGMAPENLPRLNEVRISLPVLSFAALVSMVTSVVFGLLPAFAASRTDIVDALKKGSRGVAGGGSSTLRSAVVAAEVALAFCLALGAGLLFRNLLQLVNAELGYRSEGMLVMYAHHPAKDLKELRRATQFFDQLYPELESLPGVESAAAVMGLPAGRYGSDGSFAVEGRHKFEPGEKLPHAGFRLASPRYFDTMGIRLLKGRDFTFADQFDAPFVAVISESLAKEVFPNVNPIGHRIKTGLDASDKWMDIVGIVFGVRQESPAAKPSAEIYMPLAQHPWHANEVQVVIRTLGDPSALTNPVRTLVAARNSDVAMQFTTMNKVVEESIATPRFRTFLTGAFAICALALAMAGVFSVMSFLAASRTPEFGIRMSLGAEGSDIAKLVLSKALILGLAGLALGGMLAFAAFRVVRSMVFLGVDKLDAFTVTATVVALAAAVLVAAAWPAWRASRVNPVDALRSE